MALTAAERMRISRLRKRLAATPDLVAAETQRLLVEYATLRERLVQIRGSLRERIDKCVRTS